MVDLRRRGLLRGRTRDVKPQQRMPWQVDEQQFTDQCSRCLACLDKCPEKIISQGDGGFPTIDFQRGECTFCQACVKACPEAVFRSTDEPAWQQHAVVADSCLTQQGVMCRSCEDSCEPQAISFPLRRSDRSHGVLASPVIATDSCTGCGGCVSSCPSLAIKIEPSAKALQSEEQRHAG